MNNVFWDRVNHSRTELRKLTAVVENDCFYCEKQEKWQRLEQEYTELNTNFLLHKELNFFFHWMLTDRAVFCPLQSSYSNEQLPTHRAIVRDIQRDILLLRGIYLL